MLTILAMALGGFGVVTTMQAVEIANLKDRVAALDHRVERDIDELKRAIARVDAWTLAAGG